MEGQIDFGNTIQQTGRTCTNCRAVKKRCEGTYPRCRRCEQKGLECDPTILVARRRRVDILNERIASLEAKISSISSPLATQRKTTSLSVHHDRNLLYDDVLERLRRLEDPFQPIPLDKSVPVGVFPQFSGFLPPKNAAPAAPNAFPASGPSRGHVTASEGDQGVGYHPLMPRPDVCDLFGDWTPGSEELPSYLSILLIRLFLPFRHQFHFHMDVQYFISQYLRCDLSASNSADTSLSGSSTASSPVSDSPSSFTFTSKSPEPAAQPLHPALLNAIYLASCRVLGWRYLGFEAYFLERTRHYLSESLHHADCLTHFLWANVILSAYFLMSRRIDEAYSVASSAAAMSLACGLEILPRANAGDQDGVQFETRVTDVPLLGPPLNEDEATDRDNLAHAIYLMDRSLSVIAGLPGVFSVPRVVRKSALTRGLSRASFGDVWRDWDQSALSGAQKAQDAASMTSAALDIIIHSDLSYSAKAMLVQQYVESLAHDVKENGLESYASQWDVLESAVANLAAILPSLDDPWRIEPFESHSFLNPHLLVAHLTYHGSLLVLHGLRAGTLVGATSPKAQNARHSSSTPTYATQESSISRFGAPADELRTQSKQKMLESAEAIVHICAQLRGRRGVRRTQASLLILPPIMNAARIFNSHLQSLSNPSQYPEGGPQLASCCRSITLLVDFMMEITRLYPDWVHLRRSLRDTLLISPLAFRKA